MNREERAEWPDAIRECELPDRIWFVLENRFGTVRRLTLRGLGDALGVSGERVRQLQRDGIGVLKQQTVRLRSSLGTVEGAFAAEGEDGPKSGLRSREDFMKTVQQVSRREVSDRDVQRLLVVVRALGSLGVAESIWPRMSFCACGLRPPIKGHVAVRQYLSSVARRQSARRKQSTYSSMARRVLCREGQPLHWREIAERCEALGERKNFSQSSCFNAIQSDTKAFVRVGPGTYGLVTWGIQKGEYLTDLIAEVFHKEGRCLEYGNVLHRVLGRQKVKAESVRLTLSMNVRFYRASSGKFGLRGWLQPRENQTLRTPKDLVEASDSVRRVRRASELGYDVEGIVARDKGREGG